MVYKEQADPVKGRALVQFLDWAIHQGQKYTADLLYAPLPAPVVKLIELKLKEITAQGKPLLAAR